MGIPGLTTYIANRSDRYLHYYELHDSYVVIDGNSIGCQLYSWHTKSNCAFGGDYDKYYQCVSDFFDNLLKCKVTPLVLIDGGCENKKLKTVISRAREKIRTSLYYFPVNPRTSRFLPLFIKEVFKDVMKEKGIRYVQCLFEADNAIASVARILDCPVLSYDSDFYIYGTKYIPFNTLDRYIVKSSSGTGYAMHCQMYEVDHLLRSFKGLDQSVLPLAAILLGNDYVRRSTFKNFFRQMKLSHRKAKNHNTQQQRIEMTFTWLSRYTLEKAVVQILCRLPKGHRKRVLDVIEKNINGYTNASAEILVPLGFSKEYVTRVNTYSVNHVFKFDGDINNLTYLEETCEANIELSEDEEDEDDEDDEERLNAVECSTFISDDVLVQNLPPWFINDFIMGKFPAYFMDLVVRSLYICPVQIEDYCYPSSVLTSLKIISMIYQLLISGINGKPNSMNYMIREEKEIVRRELNSSEYIFNCELPSLHNLREIPLSIRRAILNETLGITDTRYISELLPEWMLYIATAKYWMDQQQQEVFKSHCYIYSLLFCMLFNFVDDKVGKYRTIQYFQRKNNLAIANIQGKRKSINYQPQYSIDVTLAEACNEIDPDDCLLIASFFISHFEVDKKLYTNPKKFNRTVVHAFSEFQSCLRHSINLNALLGYPYEQTKVASLFNGTLLYNLYNNFRSRNNVEVYINTILKNSPSLLRLFNVLLLKVKPMFALVFSNKCNPPKKQKIKSKLPKSVAEDSDSEILETVESLCESSFYDSNNHFTLLNSP